MEKPTLNIAICSHDFETDPKINIGLNVDKEYLFSFNKSEYKTFNEIDLVSLLPLLSLEFNEFKNKITLLEQKHINQSNLKPFPYEEIVSIALESERSYWIELSLNWLNNLEKNNFTNLIKEIIANKKLPQKTRHSIIKFLG